jgi:predicted secreted protein
MNWAAVPAIAVLGGVLSWGAGYKLGEQHQTPAIRAASQAQVTLRAPADSGATVNLKAGDRFAIEVEGNVSTGYVWQVIEQPAGCQQTQTATGGGQNEGGADDRVGTPARRTFVFECSAIGEGTMRMEYRRPWEKDKKADKTFRIAVRVT